METEFKNIFVNKSFLFVNFALGIRVTGVNHGIAVLAAILRKHSYKVGVINLTEELSENEFLDKIRSFIPSIVGFSCTSHQFKYLIKYSKILSKVAGILQLAGGVHATLSPSDILSRTDVRGVCVGEGEIPMVNLLNAINEGREIADTSGFFWKINGAIKKNPIPQFSYDLSSLEFPDYSIYPRDFVVRDWSVDRSLVAQKSDIKKYIEVMISRGCPYNCHYCCNKALASVYPSSQGYFRLPSVEWSIQLLSSLLKQFPETEYIEFIDDLLIADKKWFLEFSKKYKVKINLPYRLCGRFELMTPEIIGALKDSGCVRVLFGLESGDELLRAELLNRRHSNALILEKCKLVKESGITICTLNIVGFPFETKKQMQATLELNKKIAPEFGTCYFFHPYKNTYLYELCEKSGLLKGDAEMHDITSNYSRSFIKLTGMAENDCIKFQRKLTFYFFIQTLKYRSRVFLSSNTGIKRLLLILLIMRILIKGVKLYYIDYIKPAKMAFVRK